MFTESYYLQVVKKLVQ